MHESAIAASVLRIALEEIARYEQDESQKLIISGITLKIGVLAAVEEQTLCGSFSILAEDSPAANAVLTVETEPLKGICSHCGSHVHTIKKHFQCPICQSDKVNWCGGNEMFIASLKVKSACNRHEAGKDIV